MFVKFYVAVMNRASHLVENLAVACPWVIDVLKNLSHG
ncbi:hypothetical protein KvSKV_11315 [Ketogulonicigenium vulgare]|nr:hypothetical protein KvSKV_11315 [Ketogulonicigenium vulgare]